MHLYNQSHTAVQLDGHELNQNNEGGERNVCDAEKNKRHNQLVAGFTRLMREFDMLLLDQRGFSSSI